jgi:hypothetical protein
MTACSAAIPPGLRRRAQVADTTATAGLKNCDEALRGELDRITAQDPNAKIFIEDENGVEVAVTARELAEQFEEDAALREFEACIIGG